MSYQCFEATEDLEIGVTRIDDRLCDGEQEWKNLIKLESQKQCMLEYNKLELFFLCCQTVLAIVAQESF